MKNLNPGALDLRGQLDGRTLFVMSQVAGLWAELRWLYETAEADEFQRLLRSHNLGVFHQQGVGLHLNFTEGSANHPAEADRAAGCVFYMVPPVHDLFMDTATVAQLKAWANSHGLDQHLAAIERFGEEDLAQVREALLADLSAVRLIRWEVCQGMRKSGDIRDVVTVRLATEVMAWALDWEEQRCSGKK